MRGVFRTIWFAITDTVKSRGAHRPVEGQRRYWGATGIRGGGVANTPLDNTAMRGFVDDAPGGPSTRPVKKPPHG